MSLPVNNAEEAKQVLALLGQETNIDNLMAKTFEKSLQLIVKEALSHATTQTATDISKSIVELETYSDKVQHFAKSHEEVRSAQAQVKQAIEDLKAIKKKAFTTAKALDQKVDESGIDRAKLDKCATLPGTNFNNLKGGNAIGIPREFIKDDVGYLAAHTKSDDIVRRNLRGYIGTKKEEIQRNKSTSCWRYAVAGGMEPKAIPADVFFSCFSSDLLTKKSCEQILLNIKLTKMLEGKTPAEQRRIYSQQIPFPTLTEIDAFYKEMQSLENRLKSAEITQSIQMTKTQLAALKPYMGEIQSLIDRSYKATEQGVEDWYDIQRDALKLYLKINGFEFPTEEEAASCPFAIGMTTEKKTGVRWKHWGLDVNTSKSQHTFDTVPDSAVGHRRSTFEGVNASSETHNTFTIPIKKLNEDQVKTVNDSLDHFSSVGNNYGPW